VVLRCCCQPANATADAAPHLTARRPVAVSRDYRQLSFVWLSALPSGIPLLTLPTTACDVNMLDANVLLPAVTQPSKNLYLHRIRLH
jgi:hypothetical protein